MSSPRKKKLSTDFDPYTDTSNTESAKLSTRLAMVTFNNAHSSSHLGEVFLLLVEYLQLMSQALLLMPVVSVAKLINPGCWFSLNGDKTLVILLLTAVALSTVLKYLLFLYIAIIASRNIKTDCCLLNVWGWVFKAQARVLCFFTTSIWVRIVIDNFRESSDIFGTENMGLLAFCILMIGLEYGLSIFLQVNYCYILPTKSFLSSKDNVTETLTLVQKLIIQILQMALTTNSITTSWAYVAVNLALMIFKNALYLSTLPLYNQKALSYQANLLIIASSLNFSCFFETIIKSLGYNTSMHFILITWILIGLLAVKAVNQYIDRLIIGLIARKDGSPEVLTHKINFIKNLMTQENLPSGYSYKYKFTHLINMAAYVNINRGSNGGMEAMKSPDSKTYSKEYIENLLLQYLESLAVKFPNNSFVKLYIAHFYAKKLHRFGAAIKLINEIKRSSLSKVPFSAAILSYEIQSLMRKNSMKGDKKINMHKYIESRAQFTQVKGHMLRQAELEIQIHLNVLSDAPNLYKMFEDAQRVDKYRVDTRKSMRKMLETIPDYYIDPLLTCGHYCSTLNHSVSEYLVYYKDYMRKYKKNEKSFKHEQLVEENIFQRNNVLLTISGKRADAGRILYCSKSAHAVLGRDPNLHAGRNFSILYPPCLQSFYASFFKSIADRGDSSSLENVIREFGYNSEGYLVELDFYITFHSFISQNFNYNVIMRPVPTSKQYLLLQENGDIDCATEKFAKRFNLLIQSNSSSNMPRVNIKAISEELSIVNEIFNIVALPEQYSFNCSEKTTRREGRIRRLMDLIEPAKKKDRENHNIDSEDIEISHSKVQELYSIYSTQGDNISFSEPTQKDESSMTYTYHCTVKNKFYGQMLLKVVCLEEWDDDEGDEDNKGFEQNLAEIREAEEVDHDISAENKLENKTEPENLEEKEGVWIDFRALDSPHHPHKMSSHFSGHETLTSGRMEQTEAHLLPSLSPKQRQLSSKEIMLETTKPKIIRRLDTYRKISKTLPRKANDAENSQRGKISLAGSHWSRGSQQRNILTAVNSALAVKYYPRFLRFICMSFYLLLIMIIACQVNLKSVLDQKLEYLRSGKEIISNGETRNYLLVSVQFMSRMSWDIGSGRVDPTKLGVFGLPAPLYLFVLDRHLNGLTDTNRNLLNKVNSLDDPEIRHIFFEKDVRIFETYFDQPEERFDVFDNFGATAVLIETGKRVVNRMISNIEEGREDVLFLLRNSVNDLLLKNEKTSDMLMMSLVLNRNTIENTVNIYLVTSMVFFAVSALVYVFAICKQSDEESQLMTAITKLKIQRISAALNRIKHFKETLEAETPFEDIESLDPLNNLLKSSKNAVSEKDKKGEELRAPITEGIKRKYHIYKFWLLMFIIVIAAQVVWISIYSKNSLDFFHSKQSQFFFINRLRSQISLTSTMSQELLSGNKLALTHNNPIAQEISKATNDLISMKNQVPGMFINEEFAYEPGIQDIIFNNEECSLIEAGYLRLCDALVRRGEKRGLMQVLTSLEVVLNERSEQHQANIMSNDTLLSLGTQSLEYLMILYFLSVAECEAISRIIEQSIETGLDTARQQRDFFFSVFCVCFTGCSLLCWVFVVRRFMETSNKFKKVLKIFPADVVLSNFMLKSFLLKTSNGALNCVKSNI